MLSRISSEPLSSVSNKNHNYKTFSKSPTASLLDICIIRNILSHSSGKWRDSLTMAALSFTNGCYEFHLCTIFIRNYQLEKKMIPTSLSFPSRTSRWFSKQVFT